MEPISAATALKRLSRPLAGFAADLAVSVAAKRAALLPGDLKAQLDYGILLYAVGSYDDAWLELGMVLQGCGYPLAGGPPAGDGAITDDDGRASAMKFDDETSGRHQDPSEIPDTVEGGDAGTGEGPEGLLVRNSNQAGQTGITLPGDEDNASAVGDGGKRALPPGITAAELQRVQQLLARLNLEMTMSTRY